MALEGKTINHYEGLSLIGKGGMGEVYRAHDSKLGRSVAIKLLPQEVAHDSDRVARFAREARVLASLNHPNIAGIYGVEESAEHRFLVMEFVDGETLAQRIRRGPLALDEILSIARQIAEALEAAHEKGVVHRDLKPENIKVAADGRVKVLDFGLAKVMSQASETLSNAGTMMSTSTPGMIIGTAAYMSPEQARGQEADRSADIWAFACVLYEMLTGRRAFEGTGTSEILAAVLKSEPEWHRLPAETPEDLRRLLRRCLEKESSRRLRDFHDARLDIDGAKENATTSGPHGHTVKRSNERIAWIGACVCLLALIAVLAFGGRFFAPPSVDANIYRSSILIPEGTRFPAGPSPAGRFALSPNGRLIAFVVADSANRPMIWVRQLDSLNAQPLEGTEGAAYPFWSPDSRFIAYVAHGQLKKVEVSGGSVFTLCDAAIGSTGTWNRDGVILFTPKGGDSIHRVSESGGEPTPVTTLDAGNGDIQHWYPFFLPDGRHFLYSAIGSKAKGATQPTSVYVGSLDPKQPGKLLFNGSLNAKFTLGHVIFPRGTTLMAQAFDLDTLEVRGEPAALASQLQVVGGTVTGNAGAISVSDTGVLAYQSGLNAVRSQLGWFDRTGKPIAMLGDQADYGDVALSPDGEQVAVSVLDSARGARDIWLYDVSRGQRTRFTFDPANEFEPAWLPDGNSLIFSRQKESIDLYQKRKDGERSESLLLGGGAGKFLLSLSLDGRFALYAFGGAAINRSDLWVLPLFGDRKPFAFLETSFVENQGQFSPDGKWIAYISNESGRFETYVASFPTPSVQKIVSTAGGMWPRWRRDGEELFYLTPNNMLTAATIIGEASNLQIGDVRPLFQMNQRPQVSLGSFPYDVSADGKRFLVNTFVEETTSTSITLFVNWQAQLKK